MTTDEMVEHKVRNEIGRLFVLNAVYETNLLVANQALETAKQRIAELTAEIAALKKESESHVPAPSANAPRPADEPDATGGVTDPA